MQELEKAVILRRISKAMEHVEYRSASRFDYKTSVPAKPHRKMIGFESESKRLTTSHAPLAAPAARLSLLPDRVFYFGKNYPLQ